MKKLTFILIAAAALAACSNDELIDGTQGYDNAIVFGNIATRAAITSANDVTEFGVWARMNTGDDGTAEADVYVDLLKNERVYKSGEWTYDNTRYWVYDRTFHFFAYLPYAASGVEEATLTQSGNNYPGYKIPFTMTDAADIDLMIAHKTERTVTGNSFPTSVALEFEHALSQINFKVAKNGNNDENKVVITKLTLSGVQNKGDFYTTRIANSDYWKIATDATSVSLYPVVTGEGLGVPTDAKVVLESPLLVIPQEVKKNTILLTIEYNFYNDAAGTSFAYKNSVSKYLPDTNSWESGKSYVYNLTLAAEDNDILFGVPTIENDWGEGVQTGGTLIIK